MFSKAIHKELMKKLYTKVPNSHINFPKNLFILICTDNTTIAKLIDIY